MLAALLDGEHPGTSMKGFTQGKSPKSFRMSVLWNAVRTQAWIPSTVPLLLMAVVSVGAARSWGLAIAVAVEGTGQVMAAAVAVDAWEWPGKSQNARKLETNPCRCLGCPPAVLSVTLWQHAHSQASARVNGNQIRFRGWWAQSDPSSANEKEAQKDTRKTARNAGSRKGHPSETGLRPQNASQIPTQI